MIFTILIADDDMSERQLMQAFLASLGYRVVGAGDGEEALAVARAERPDLILLGLAMPVLDGFGFLRAFRPASSIPIIMLTTWDAATDAITVAGLELGADDCLTKPVRLLELHARIQTLLRRTTPSSA